MQNALGVKLKRKRLLAQLNDDHQLKLKSARTNSCDPMNYVSNVHGVPSMNTRVAAMSSPDLPGPGAFLRITDTLPCLSHQGSLTTIQVVTRATRMMVTPRDRRAVVRSSLRWVLPYRGEACPMSSAQSCRWWSLWGFGWKGTFPSLGVHPASIIIVVFL